MGWTKVADLNKGAMLYTRGGLSGLQIYYNGDVIEIPKAVILDLLAEEVREEAIGQLEQMATEEVLATLKLTKT